MRYTVDGHPLQFYLAARPELRQKSVMFCDIFKDILNGDDIHYGLNYGRKIELDAIQAHNNGIRRMGNYNPSDIIKFEPPTNSKILQDFDEQSPESISLGICSTFRFNIR